MSYKAIVHGDQWVRVRAQPNTTAAILGGVKTGDVVDVIENVNGWSKVALFAGGVELRTDSLALTPIVVYMLSTLLTPVVVTPVTTKPAIGVNLLFNPAGAAQTSDCKVYLCMNNSDEAARLANCDPVGWTPAKGNFVMYRQYHAAQAWSPDQMIAQLGPILGKGNKNVVLTLCNEWDIAIPGAGNTPEGMSKFCDWTIECVSKLNAMKWYNIAVMTASVGTPEFNNQQVCDVIKAKLAPLWNNGTIRFIDMHNYSPTMEHIYQDNDLIWYEKRWEMLFTKCGFLPTAMGRVVSGETGVDEGGKGGFPAHNATDQQVVDWVKRDIEIQSRPVVVNGVSYPSPYLCGTLFQCFDRNTNQGGWAGYNCEKYLPALHDQLWHNG